MITHCSMFIVNDAANTLISHRTVLSLFRLIGAGSTRFGSLAGIRLVRSTGIRSSSGISFLTSLMLVLLSPAYAGFSIVYSIVTPSCSARRLINTSMIFSIFTYTTSLKMYAVQIVSVASKMSPYYWTTSVILYSRKYSIDTPK